MQPISLVSDADADESADMDGEKHSQPKTPSREFTEKIDEARFVRQYNFFHLLTRMLCLCLALLLSVAPPFFTTLCREVGQLVITVITNPLHSLDRASTWSSMRRP